jgi:hypothetical protein
MATVDRVGPGRAGGRCGRVAAFAFALLAGATAAGAATFRVDRADDGGDVLPGDGVCATSAGWCTLRAAAEEANAHAGPDEVRLPAGVPLNVEMPAQADVGASGGIVVSDDLEIIGATTPIVALGPAVVLEVVAGELRLSGVVLQGAEGPGIRNAARLVVLESTVLGNRGGGIENRGEALIERSTIAANGEHEEGVGVSTRGGRTMLRNVTVSGNAGGGVENAGGRTDLRNTTVAFNHGVGVVASAGTVSVAASLLAQNEGGDCAGRVESLGFNVIRQSCACLIEGDRSTNVLAVPFTYLGGLEDNGGPTPTHALLPGSVAIDLGAACEPTDQRGAPRPQGVACDAGAYEATPRGAPGRIALRPVRTARVGRMGLRAVCTLGQRPKGPDAYCDAVGYTDEARRDDGCPVPVLRDTYRRFRGRKRVHLTSRLTAAGRELLARRGTVPVVLLTEAYDGEDGSATTVTSLTLSTKRPFLRVRGPLRTSGQRVAAGAP